MTSPICTVNGEPTTNGVDVTRNTAVTIQLIDLAGVYTWSILCIGTDDILTVADINATLTVTDPITKTATFTMPDSDGYSCIFQSIVNNGRDINGRVVSDYTTTFKVSTLVSGKRTIAVNEMMEGHSTAGWAKPVNDIIRSGTSAPSGVAGGDLNGSYPNPTVAKLQGKTVSNVAPDATKDGYVLTWVNGSSEYQLIPTADIFVAGGDLTGTSSYQEVVSLTGIAGDGGNELYIYTTGANIRWDADTSSPSLSQYNTTTDAAANLTIEAQSTDLTDSSGGHLTLTAGSGTTGANSTGGSIVLNLGAGNYTNGNLIINNASIDSDSSSDSGSYLNISINNTPYRIKLYEIVT